MIEDFIQIHDPVKMCIGAALQSREFARKVIALDDSQIERVHDLAIIRAMRTLEQKGSTPDLAMVDFQTDGKWTEYLLDAMRSVPTVVYAEHYLNAVKDLARRRKLRTLANSMFLATEDKTRSVEEIAATAINGLDMTFEAMAGSVSTSDAISELITEFGQSSMPRAKFGLPLLDKIIGGMLGGRLYVIGARPAVGKSALAMSAALSSCADGTVLLCSYEMQASEIVGRILSNLSGVSSQNIAHRLLSQEEHDRLIDFYPSAMNLPIRFIRGSSTLEAVRTEALILKKRGNLKLVIVDYLQLMSSGMKAENRRIEVGQISRGLKTLAMEIDVPILALSQLNRVSEGSPSKIPSMAEMRESGDIEQDADAVILMYRPSNDEEDRNACTRVRLLIDKNRQGNAGVKIDTLFEGDTMRFRPLSSRE